MSAPGRPLLGRLVHPVGFGAMALSLSRRPPADEALAALLAAIDAGAELIDTADAYCLDDTEAGHSERLVAAARRARPHVLVATKGGFTRPRGRWVLDASPAHLRRACEQSLQALGVEAIDLYQLHRPDARVPFAESVGALCELRAAGKVRHVGLSNVTAAQLAAALTIVPIASVQNLCHPLDPGPLRDGVARLCQERGVALLAYSPFGGLRRHAELAAHPLLGAIAAKHGATPYQVALAWLLCGSPVLIPLPSARSPVHARDNSRAAALALDDQDLQALARSLPLIPPTPERAP